MVILHNLSAMNTQRQFGINAKNKTKSSEKLASGYKINRAADDAAGLSISEKMRRQIRGLTQGVSNAEDGVSLCQVADGALSEVNEMLHRITELSVKAANGTNSEEERAMIQEEINHILQEIERVSDTTTFNEHKIFDLGNSNVTETPNISNRPVFPSNDKVTLVKLDVSGKPNTTRAQNYNIDATLNGIDINQLSFGWDEWKKTDGTKLDINNISTGTYNIELDGMQLQLSLDSSATVDDIVNSLKNVEFKTNETITNKVNVVDNIKVDSSQQIVLRGTTDLTLYADERGISTSSSRVGITWESMGVNKNNISPGTYTYEDNITGLKFDFSIKNGATLDSLIDSLNGTQLTTTVLDDSHYFAGQSYAHHGDNNNNDLNCMITPYNAFPPNLLEDGIIVDEDKEKMKGIDNSGTTGAYFRGKYDSTTDTITFKYSGTSETDYTVDNDGVEFKITAESMNALKNYDYSKESTFSNPQLLLKFETDAGSYMYFVLENKGGTNSFNNAVNELTYTDSNSYWLKINNDFCDYLVSVQDLQFSQSSTNTYDVNLQNNHLNLVEYSKDVVNNDVNDSNNNISNSSSGNFWIQSGCDSGDGMWLEIDNMNISILGIKDIDISTVDGANHAISIIDDALQKISSNRAKIGAQQNRLEHTITNEENIIENTTAAESQIRDTDMAKEMVRFSNLNILDQVGQSMMAQANQMNQGVLSLLSQ